MSLYFDDLQLLMSLAVTSHSLQPLRGFHSTLSTTFVLDHPDLDCSFFALYTFPQGIIIDRHELMDHGLSYEFWGESNLELPVFALDQTENSVLLVNATPVDAFSQQVVLDIPVHARYAEPGSSLQSITIPPPTCFWACPRSANASTAFSSESPWANSKLLDSLAHFSVANSSSHCASLQVPAASKGDMFSVEVGTAAVVLVAFLWLFYRTWRVATELQSCHLKEE